MWNDARQMMSKSCGCIRCGDEETITKASEDIKDKIASLKTKMEQKSADKKEAEKKEMDKVSDKVKTIKSDPTKTVQTFALAQIDSEQVDPLETKTAGGRHNNLVIDATCFDLDQTPAVMIELSKGQEATIMLRKPNKGVNASSGNSSVSSFWIETVLEENNADKLYKLEYNGKFYRKGEDEWTSNREECGAGHWPYFGWTITANEEHIGLGAFLLEGALLTCPSETLRFNEYEDRAYKFVVKVIE